MGKMTHKLIVRSLHPSSIYSYSLSMLSRATIPVDHLNVDRFPLTWHLFGSWFDICYERCNQLLSPINLWG